MGKNWAITIGINQYDNLTPLNFAKRDAEAMRTFCLKEMGFEQVYYFSDDSDSIASDNGPPLKSQPTFATLSRFLRTRFEKPFLNAGDNLWFFFAGHGRRYRDRDYLMPIDVDPGNLEHTAISLNDITERLRRCGADNVILFLDACRNEGARDGEGIGLKQQGVITLFSCSPNERSYEIEALEQGAFTHALLQGLRVQGEGNCATVERLYDYLKHQVLELNRKHQKPRQTPYAVAEPATKLHLILVPKFATLADGLLLRSSAGEAENENDLELAEQLWTHVLAVWPADPQAIKAVKRIAVKMATAVPQTVKPTPLQTQESRSPELISAQPSLMTFQFEVVTVDATGKEVQRKPGTAQFFAEDLGNSVTLEMVSIPSGSFLMGSPSTEKERTDSEGPQHPVTVSEFFMGKYPVTQAQWKAVAALPQVKQYLKSDSACFKGADLPIERVSWNEAVEFCTRLSKQTGQHYRLPSEAEWEYACRAGTTTPFHFGETLTPDLANCAENYTYARGPKGKYLGQTTKVGIFPPNVFGLFDMHGNVWEWCQDLWHANYQKAPLDGSAWLNKNDNSYYLMRGGAWNLNPRHCRSACRGNDNPDFRSSGLGFRVVCSVPRTL
ncbi:MAG: SUMF1/EgtB/PvdO family nonheme iron enzyme [Acaryochloridaceae cyanobacterium RU_4_10]|nr:SUMF1/EgtB/PvdO family nonheme iron enzyme [Acaryochloridaceae cyanobacterium RU_4_10]